MAGIDPMQPVIHENNLWSFYTYQFTDMPLFRSLRKVSHSGRVITFRVPAKWNEEVEQDGTRIIWDPHNGNALRLTLLTSHKIPDDPVAAAEAALRSGGRPAKIERLGTNVAVKCYKEECTGDDGDLSIFWWEVAHFTPPKFHRLAMFSFSVLAETVHYSDTQKSLKLLDREIRQAEFGPVEDWEV